MYTVKEYSKATNKSTSAIYSRIKKNPDFADKTGKVMLLTSEFIKAWAYSDGFHLTDKAVEAKTELAEANYQIAKDKASIDISTKNTRSFDAEDFTAWLDSLTKDYEVRFIKDKIRGEYSVRMIYAKDVAIKAEIEKEMVNLMLVAARKLVAIRLVQDYNTTPKYFANRPTPKPPL
jgi:hypothetical protein